LARAGPAGCGRRRYIPPTSELNETKIGHPRERPDVMRRVTHNHSVHLDPGMRLKGAVPGTNPDMNSPRFDPALSQHSLYRKRAYQAARPEEPVARRARHRPRNRDDGAPVSERGIAAIRL